MAELRPINSAQAQGTGSSSSGLAFPTAPANGSTLIAYISTNTVTTNRVNSISQSGASWSRIPNSVAAQTDLNMDVWQATNVSSAGTGVTVNLASSLTYNIHIMEVPGTVTASVIDGNAVKAGNATSASSPVTKSLITSTLSQQVECLIVGAVSDSTISSSVAVPTGYTQIIGSGTGTGLRMMTAYRIYADTVAAETVSVSSSGSPTLNIAGCVIGLKAAANQIALRNGNTINNTGSTSNITLTLPKTPIAGNQIVVATTSLTTAGIVTGVSATNIPFTKDVSESSVAPATTIWSGPVGASPSPTITVSGTAVEKIAAAAEFFGLLTGGLDQTQFNNGVSTSPNTGTTSATTQADELVVAGLGAAVNQTPGTGVGYTSIANVAGSASALSMAFKIVSTTGAQSMAGTLPAPLAWSGLIATYKQGASNFASNGIPDSLLLLGAGT